MKLSFVHSFVVTCLGALVYFSEIPVSYGQAEAKVPNKIRGEIYHHQKLKKLPPGRALLNHRRAMFAAGINGADLDREEVVIYVTERLTKAEIAALRVQGIEIDPDLWIPPVADHPLGYHLGRTRYESLPILARNARVVQVNSAETQSRPQNDVGGALIHVDDVQAGTGLTSPRNGAGIRVAIADSGVDINHPDLPPPAEAFDVTDGVGVANWTTNVANLVRNHGTHVVGTVMASGGLSGGRYVGAAPGATWAFYKIGNDTTGTASDADQIEAINRAATLGYDVFTMSYGGLNDFFMDGSGSMEQAIDNAVAGGMAVFISAGNSADDNIHDSVSVAPGVTSAAFGYTVNNAAGMAALTAPETIQVIWRDNQPGNTQITLTCTNLGAGESLNLVATATSSRATDARQYALTPNIPIGARKTYNFGVSNSAAAGDAPLVHLYATASGTFDTADPNYTIGSPAIANGAIAVGAWVHRNSWTDFNGTAQGTGETVNTLATFSSLGPRIDGLRKPEVVAPGAAVISLLSTNNGTLRTPTTNDLVIDNDGQNLNGSGPANYAISQGTSMACPMAAGVAALILQQNPNLTPAQLRETLTLTASSAAYPNNSVGYGLIDALAAVREAETSSVWVQFNYVGTESGTFTQPFNTVVEGTSAVPVRPPNFPYLPRLRIKAGTTLEKPSFEKPMRVEEFGGAVTLGGP